MILADWQIEELCAGDNPMISPFVPNQIRFELGERVVSYGLSSYGYDIRLGKKAIVLARTRIVKDDRWTSDRITVHEEITEPIDVKNMTADEWETLEPVGDGFILPPNGCALVETLETFHMPSNVTAHCLGKSTYARATLLVNVTPLEAGWRGVLTVELKNLCPDRPLKVYIGEGIAQLQFFRGEQCRVSYADKQGKYQNQDGVTLARM